MVAGWGRWNPNDLQSAKRGTPVRRLHRIGMSRPFPPGPLDPAREPIPVGVELRHSRSSYGFGENTSKNCRTSAPDWTMILVCPVFFCGVHPRARTLSTTRTRARSIIARNHSILTHVDSRGADRTWAPLCADRMAELS